jgi:hypothetical protein
MTLGFPKREQSILHAVQQTFVHRDKGLLPHSAFLILALLSSCSLTIHLHQLRSTVTLYVFSHINFFYKQS